MSRVVQEHHPVLSHSQSYISLLPAEHEFTVPQSAALHAVGLLSSVVPPEGCCLQTWLNIPDDRVFS